MARKRKLEGEEDMAGPPGVPPKAPYGTGRYLGTYLPTEVSNSFAVGYHVFTNSVPELPYFWRTVGTIPCLPSFTTATGTYSFKNYLYFVR